MVHVRVSDKDRLDIDLAKPGVCIAHVYPSAPLAAILKNCLPSYVPVSRETASVRGDEDVDDATIVLNLGVSAYVEFKSDTVGRPWLVDLYRDAETLWGSAVAGDR